MRQHAAPFTGWGRLPADLAKGFCIVYGCLLGDLWQEARRWRLVRLPLPRR